MSEWSYDRSPHRRKWLVVLVFLLIAAAGGLAYWRLAHKSPSAKQQPAAQSAKNPTEPKATQISGRYLLNGTVTWARAVESEAKGDYAQPFSQLDTFNRAAYDAWSTDLECPITNNAVPYQLQISNLIFNCRPEFLPAATKFFNIFDLANNHTDNQGGEKGLQETRQHLDAAGVQYFGTFDAADSQNTCEVIALPVRIINGLQKAPGSSAGLGAGEQRTESYQEYGDGAAQIATTPSAENTSGVGSSADKQTGVSRGFLPVAFCGWHYFSRQPLPGEIEIMDRYAKIMPVFAFVEMGVEYHPKASDTQVAIAHQVIDHDPEFLIANNPHWVQNTEVYKGKLIVYSTGNFIFDQLDSETNRSASIDAYFSAQYDDNLAKWLALGPVCAKFHDDCLAQAEKQALSKVKLQLKYGVVAGQNGYKIVTHKADAATQKAVEERMNWSQTCQQLGYNACQ